jgi:D-3-phosphoglycerate dehydrogenase
MALLLALAKKIVMLNNYVKNGNWDLNIAVPIYKLSHKVLGLAGFGNIGRKVAVRAKSFE